MQVIISKSGFLYPDSDPDQPHYLMASKLDHGSSSVFFHKVLTSVLFA